MAEENVFSGKTVEEAVAEGLRKLGLSSTQVEVEVLNKGSRGLFGLGGEPAQVRLTARPAAKAAGPVPDVAPTLVSPAAPPVPEQPSAPVGQAETYVEASAGEAQMVDVEPAMPAAVVAAEDEVADEAAPADAEADEAEVEGLAVELLGETVRLMGFDAGVEATWCDPDADNEGRYLLLNLHGHDLGALIGRRGDTLNNLQYLLRLMVNQQVHAWKNIVVDVESYRQHRVEHLTQLALRSAEQVTSTGRPLALEPMPPSERRIIHLALRDYPGIVTESSGEGERRKIQILPQRG